MLSLQLKLITGFVPAAALILHCITYFKTLRGSLELKTAMGLLYRRIFLWEKVSYKPCGAAWGVTYPSLDSYITQGESSSLEILLQ